LTDNLRQDVEAALAGAYAIERELGGDGMSRVFVATERAPIGGLSACRRPREGEQDEQGRPTPRRRYPR
jgi:hypothetical protein